MRKFGLFATTCAMVTIALTIAPKARAEDYSANPVTVTNTIAATTTLTQSAVMDLRKYEDVALESSSVLTNAGTATLQYVGAWSGSGSSYESVPGFTWTIPQSGTLTTVAVTNFSAGARGYLKIVSISNNETSTVNRLLLKLIHKTRIHGNELN